MTYRVVQVTEDHLDAAGDGGAAVSVVSTAAFAGAQQAVAQVWVRLEGNMEKKKQCVQKVSNLPAHILYFYIYLYRLSSRTLLVMEAVQQGKQWGERHASPTSQQQQSVTVQLQPSQCRPRLIQPSHRLEVSFTCQSPKNCVCH